MMNPITSISNYLQFPKMNDEIKEISKIYLLNHLFRNFSIYLLSTFLVLYFLDIISIAQLGIIISVRFFTQMIFDYPTGTLGDQIGQRYVLLFAYLGHTISLIIFIIANNFNLILIGIVIQGISLSQESGALSSWYDSKYKSLETDKEVDKIYGSFMGAAIVFTDLVTGISIILGGVISSFYSRLFLLKIHLITIIINFLIILLTISNEEITQIETAKQSGFRKQFREGISFLKNREGLLFYYLGLAIVMGSIFGIWFELMLFPYFFSYSGTDLLTGVLRSAIFTLSILLGVIGVKIANNVENLKLNLWINYVLLGLGWFTTILIFTIILPPTNTLYLPSFIIAILIGASVTIPLTIYTILDKKLQLEIIDNSVRNSMYSVSPTLITLFGAIFSFIGGFILLNYGFRAGMISLIGFNSIGLLTIAKGLINMDLEIKVNKQSIISRL